MANFKNGKHTESILEARRRAAELKYAATREREVKVGKLIREGLSPEDCAARMGMSRATLVGLSTRARKSLGIAEVPYFSALKKGGE